MTGRVVKVIGVSAVLLGALDFLGGPDWGTIAAISVGFIIIAIGKTIEHRKIRRVDIIRNPKEE